MTSARTPCSSLQRRASAASASASRASSSGSGRIACTDRRAAVRLSPREVARRVDVPAPVPVVARLLGRLELRDDPGEALRERVV